VGPDWERWHRNRRHINLELFNQDEIKHWSIPTGPLQKIYLSGEQLNRGKIFYSYQQDDTMVTRGGQLNRGDPVGD